MKSMNCAMALAAGLSAMLVTDAYGGIRVLLLGDNSTAGWVEDVRSKIQATGRVDASFDIFNNDGSGVPALSDLKNYDVVVVWTDGGLDDGVGLGNVLADYVDAGGAVVETAFGFFTTGIGIQGRWKSGNYTTMTCTVQGGGAATIGARQVPSHPILRDVATFSGGTSAYRCTTTLTPGSYRIADWSDGTPLVATNHSHAGKVAGLNFYPPSSTVRADFWDASTGGGLLLANAINFAANNTGDVLICGAPATSGWSAEVRDRVLESGRVGGRVDLFPIGSATPPLGLLVQYDAVLVFTDANSADPTTFGNNLADYVDQGGGVTVCMFASGYGVGGRFGAGGYQPLAVRNFTTGAATLGARLIAQHPLLDNIGTFSGGTSSYRAVASLAGGAVRIADWSDGNPLLAAMHGHKGRIAALNFYPASTVSRGDFWDRSTDGGALLGNALAWTARNDNDVLIIGDNGITGSLDDIRAKVSPLVNGTIDTYDYVSNGAMGIAQMRKYDSIITFGNSAGAEAGLFGDRLADFVDGGGGVVDCFGANVTGFGPQGRWVSGAYSALNVGSYVLPGTITMSAKLYPLHPSLNLVASLNIGSSGFHGTGGVRPGALRLADLSDGEPLAAEKSTGAGRVMSLNFFPFSADVFSGGWVTSTDGARLLANSLNHVARSDIDALVVATEPANSSITLDGVRKIRQTGRIRGRIDIFDNSVANPPLGLLAAYESTMLWADGPQPDASGLGNLLAVYANNGGGVVTTFGVHYGAPFSIGGLWASRPYTPATDGAGYLSTPGAGIGFRQSPEHPVLAGVDVFSLGAGGIHDFVGTSRIGERIANLTNGRPLVAEGKVPGARQSLALNMLMASTDGYSGGWDPGTKGGVLMANALTYVSADRPCAVDFNNDGFVDFFDYDDYVNCFESGICPPGRDADINGDGFVDFFDYDAFVAGFERGC